MEAEAVEACGAACGIEQGAAARRGETHLPGSGVAGLRGCEKVKGQGAAALPMIEQSS